MPINLKDIAQNIQSTTAQYKATILGTRFSGDTVARRGFFDPDTATAKQFLSKPTRLNFLGQRNLVNFNDVAFVDYQPLDMFDKKVETNAKLVTRTEEFVPLSVVNSSIMSRLEQYYDAHNEPLVNVSDNILTGIEFEDFATGHHYNVKIGFEIDGVMKITEEQTIADKKSSFKDGRIGVMAYLVIENTYVAASDKCTYFDVPDGATRVNKPTAFLRNVGNALQNNKVVIHFSAIDYLNKGLKNFRTTVLRPLFNQLFNVQTADNLFGFVDDKIDNFNTYKVLVNQLNNRIPDLIEQTVTMLQAYTSPSIMSSIASNHGVDTARLYITDTFIGIINLFTKIEAMHDWKFGINVYNRLYQAIVDVMENYNCNSEYINMVINRNLRLMFSQQLSNIEKLKVSNQIHTMQIDNSIKQNFLADPNYSNEQKALVVADEHFVVGTAGAGSGKSHTLVGRLKYLDAQNEDLSSVMVLSFTNIAAKNILARYSQIKSHTVSDLFNKIYTATFPQQKLSYTATLMNSMKLLNPSSPAFSQFHSSDVEFVIDSLRKCFIDLLPHTNGDIAQVTVDLSAIINAHFDIVICLLNVLGQTTLELQPLIIHAIISSKNRMNKLVVPPQFVGIKHIITDESQDISTFEYVLLLTLVSLYKSNMMIIGDGSQTLYEFRNSNPRFLNSIEASGVFKVYRLTTNYRSQQEILHYANQWLDVIEANQFAKIQLMSNQIKNTTVHTFKQSVVYENAVTNHRQIGETVKAIEETFQYSLKFQTWLIEKVKSGEQVALLAHTHKELDTAIHTVNKLLTKYGLTQQAVKIAKAKNKQKTLISRTISKYTNELNQIPISLNHAIEYKIKFVELVDKHRDQTKTTPLYVIKALNEVFTGVSYQTLKNIVLQDPSRMNELTAVIIDSLLKIEISVNNMDQIMSKKDIPDFTNEPVVGMTIHGAKGLEFDNTVVIFNNASSIGISQEKLRLFGVAFTRAKKSEYILNIKHYTDDQMTMNTLNKMEYNPIESAYERCIKLYNQLNNISNVPSNISNP